MRKDETRSRPLAKRLRAAMTDAETILWARLRRDGGWGRRFRRQHPVGPYVADFACVPASLIIEIDGATHSTDIEAAHDIQRDHFLHARGWRVFRVTNEDIYKSLDDVLEGIARLIESPPPRRAAGPPPQAGEETKKLSSPAGPRSETEGGT